jgi:hypothetical protein
LALLGFAEDLDQDLQEAPSGVPVLGSVVRVLIKVLGEAE